MLRICDWTTLRPRARLRSSLKPLAVAFAGTVLLFTPSVRAATIDWNVVGPANYDSSLDPGPPHSNWIDTTQTNTTVVPVSVPSNAPVGIPGNNDDAFVRNGGTAEITSATIQRSLNVGVNRTLYTDDGISVITPTEQGGNGTVNMTGGSILGPVDLVGPDFRYGTQIRLGGTGLAAQNYTGTFTQSAGKITLNVGSTSGSTSSNIIIGNGASTSTPTSVFTLSGTGQIGMVYDAGGHRGISVRNGTFNMTGGSIFNEEAVDVNLYNQQFMQIASTNGTANGPVGSAGHTVATANFSGGTVDVHHGLRVAPNNRAEGYVTISGTASLKLGNDLQLAANAGTAGSIDAAYGQLDMSAGYLQVGQATPLAANTNYDKKFILGDAGRGVFTQTGGTVVVGDQLRMSNNAVSSALFTMKDPAGGPTGVPFSFSAKNVETRNSATVDTTLNSDVLIDSPDATFIQTNYLHPTLGTVLTGKTNIGGNGKSTFEIKRGNVLFGQVTAGGTNGGNLELSSTANARATLKLTGGKLTIGGNVTRTDTSVASSPTVNLTGGQLILDPKIGTPTAVQWATNFTNAGSQITTRPNALLLVNVGIATTVPANFAMTSGSWDLDISPGVGFSASLSDRFFLVNTTAGTAALTGGTLNLNYLSSYVPQIGDSRTIVRTPSTYTVNLGSVGINAPGGDPNWKLEKVLVGSTNIDIRLTYVPEPASCVLVAMGLMMGIIGIRRRS